MGWLRSPITVAVLVLLVLFLGYLKYRDWHATILPPTVPVAAFPPGQQQLAEQVGLLRQEVEDLKAILQFAGIVFAVVISIGSVTSLYSMWTFERRATESHDLAIKGEKSSQDRSTEVHQTFLKGSQETLGLVNATLELAKEASQRSAMFLERKAKDTLQDLDKAAKHLLDSVDSRNFSALLSSDVTTADLQTLSEKINSFEINKFMLVDSLSLTPACNFIRGMGLHLNQQYTDAMRYWQDVTAADGVDTYLRSLAWYWIGCEQNNLGHFHSATVSFEHALTGVTDVTSFELQRIKTETKFFDRDDTAAIALIEELEDQIKALGQSPIPERDKAHERLTLTLGNIQFVVGRALIGSDPVKAEQRLSQALNNFASIAERKPNPNRWARFGYAECLWTLGDEASAKEAFQRVHDDAILESIHKIEPRMRALAAATLYICALRVQSDGYDRARYKQQVLEAMGRVDQRISIYSQFRRRNVSKTDFIKDLAALENPPRTHNS